MSVLYKNNPSIPPKPNTTSSNKALLSNKISNNKMDVSSNNVGTQASTIKLNDFLFRLSKQEKLEKSKLSSQNNYKFANIKQNINQNEISSKRFTPIRSSEFKGTTPDRTKTLSTSNSSPNFTKPSHLNTHNNCSVNRAKLCNTSSNQFPITYYNPNFNTKLTNNNPQNTYPPSNYSSNPYPPNNNLSKPYSSNINQYPSLKKFTAAPPTSEEVFVMTSSNVVVMDTTDQPDCSDHFNSILRPREKKIMKPPDPKQEMTAPPMSSVGGKPDHQGDCKDLPESKIKPSMIKLNRQSQWKSKSSENSFDGSLNSNDGGRYGGVGCGSRGGGGGFDRGGVGGSRSKGRGGISGRIYDGDTGSSGALMNSYDNGVARCEGAQREKRSDGKVKGVEGTNVGVEGGHDFNDYCNLDALMPSRKKELLRNDVESLYENDRPTPALRSTLIADQADRVKRMNSFFGEKKDSVTELESKVFNELILREQLTAPAANHSAVEQASSLPFDSRSILSDTSAASTNEAEKLKKVVKSNLKNFNKNLNKSCENLMSSIANNNAINNIPSWKRKIMKGMKNQLKQTFPSLLRDKTSVAMDTHVVPISQCHMSAANSNLPFLVECCIEIVERRGLEEEGVYRLPSKHDTVNQMFKDVQKDPFHTDFTQDCWRSIACVGGLLKLFLRKLPDSLITQDLYESFIAASDKVTSKEKMVSIRSLVHRLPPANYETLRQLACHLHLVASHASTNTMDAHNLAIMFGPSLVHSKFKATNQMLAEMNCQIDVIENIIKYHDWVFSENAVEDLRLEVKTKRNRFKNGSKVSSMELLPSVETLLELAGSEEEEEEDVSNFAFIRQNFFTRSTKSSRFYTDEFEHVASIKNSPKTHDKLSLSDSFKKKN